MDGQFAGLTSFLIYMLFFGWLGRRRGVLREVIVFVTALLGWLVMSQRGYIVVNVANIGAASLEFAKAGGFSGSTEEAFAALSNAPTLVTSDTQDAFLYMVWVGAVISIYLFTNLLIRDEQSKGNGWSILVGMMNGIFFAIIFLPGITSLLSSGEGTVEAQESMDLVGMLDQGSHMLKDGFTDIWSAITPLGPNGILIVVTGVLVLAAISISGGANAKS